MKNRENIFTAFIVFASFVVGTVYGGRYVHNSMKESVHTEKHGCEYVEKAECKQVWVKKGE